MARHRLGGAVWLAAMGAVVVLLAGAGAARSDNQDTHGRDAVPDYARVFNQDQVGRLDVRIGTSDWQAVLADMQNMAGPSGFGLNVPFSNDQFAACAGRDEVELLPRTPIYVPADISFDGETFRRVGYRLKGNSTLLLTWRRGSEKLPFRLNFDGLEARFPETKDQTFFGFPNLSFTNNGLDNTYLRGKVVTDLFRDAGVPSAATAFMRAFLDRGTGPSYQGLFTMLATVFEPGRVIATLRSEQARIARFVVGPEGEPFGRNLAGSAAQFDAALFGPNGLIGYVNNRAAAVRQVLRDTP